MDQGLAAVLSLLGINLVILSALVHPWLSIFLASVELVGVRRYISVARTASTARPTGGE